MGWWHTTNQLCNRRGATTLELSLMVTANQSSNAEHWAEEIVSAKTIARQTLHATSSSASHSWEAEEKKMWLGVTTWLPVLVLSLRFWAVDICDFIKNMILQQNIGWVVSWWTMQRDIFGGVCAPLRRFIRCCTYTTNENVLQIRHVFVCSSHKLLTSIPIILYGLGLSHLSFLLLWGQAQTQHRGTSCKRAAAFDQPLGSFCWFHSRRIAMS